MDKLIATVEILRQWYEYRGYVHLKIMPGVDKASVERAVQLADRVSVNLEGANAARLRALAPEKDFRELFQPMRWVKEIVDAQVTLGRKRVSQTTQFVVGAAGESDRELLSTVAQLYREVNLGRAYFSAFHPVPDTPLDGQAETPAWREHRLYQSDFLMRRYGFAPGEFVLDERGNLPREADPKLAWAARTPGALPGRSQSRQPRGVDARAGHRP